MTNGTDLEQIGQIQDKWGHPLPVCKQIDVLSKQTEKLEDHLEMQTQTRQEMQTYQILCFIDPLCKHKHYNKTHGRRISL